MTDVPAKLLGVSLLTLLAFAALPATTVSAAPADQYKASTFIEIAERARDLLVRLRDHASDPAAAWPAGVRGRLPGPLGMYATLAGVLATPLALGMLAWWLHQPPAPPRPPATPAPTGRRVLPPAVHPGVPMLPRPEHDREAP